MEFHQLEYFKVIVEQGSINKAAKELHMSQPPLTYAMNQLEQELGTSLFMRTRKGIILTPAGKLFYQRAVDLLSRSESIKREVMNSGTKQVFRIGLTPTVVPIATPYLVSLTSMHSEIELVIYEGNTYHLKDLLDDGTIDAAIIRTPVELQGCHFHTILTEPMCAVTKYKKNAKPQSFDDLAKQPLILYRRYEDYILKAFAKYNHTCNVVSECDDARTAMHLAKAGFATAIVPYTIAQTESHCTIQTIHEKEFRTDVLFCYRNQSLIIQSLLEILKKKD